MRLSTIILSLLAAGCATIVAPGYGGPRSDHFDGVRFQNAEPFEEQPVDELARWQLHRHRGSWPGAAVVPHDRPPERVGRGELRITFINHATVLIQMDGLNILTDPIWSDVAGPENEIGARRHRPPGLRLDELPRIDVVLISHNHYDHLDVPTLRSLALRFHPRVITGLGNSVLLDEEGMPGATELDWWQSTPLDAAVRVTFVPARHWSGRGLTDRRRTLWGGFVITGAAGTVYFAGDTGDGRFIDEIAARFAPIRLALLPIAPFRPRWYMARKHLSPGDAVNAARRLGAATTVAIHWGTFELGDDGEREPADSLASGPRILTPAPRIWALENGEGRAIP